MIKNIAFDIGNVLIRWDPLSITKQAFPLTENPSTLSQQLFKSQIWFDLNLGKISELEAIQIYQKTLNIPKSELEKMMVIVKESLLPLDDSISVLSTCYHLGYSLYSITDNTKEIIEFLIKKYHFFHMFKGIVVSAHLGVLKPNAGIYQHLIHHYKLLPHETVFIDDIEKNVEGAKLHGLHGIQFENATSLRKELQFLLSNSSL